ncbi:uncharacterized protein J7T54_008382 [Emericellopsis cladophorae]|uniref:Uncharacterized protein n=1 Tax=Emericellopsis cladophorae TaxID=2686198 RepID=A0A9P9Y2S3_9HYPO|nr:uncharacterized protein J7T54_008382 [Emericellopsis cladophorae]KAI6782296.1 hypothetical protein J7T54_008382 [Emericellopsis cladophorae]
MANYERMETTCNNQDDQLDVVRLLRTEGQPRNESIFAEPKITADFLSADQSTCRHTRSSAKSDMNIPSAPSAPLTERPVGSAFTSPMRPKSTPFPYPNSERRTQDEYDIETSFTHRSTPSRDMESDDMESLGASGEREASNAKLRLGDLPLEMLEAILDHIFGFRVSATSLSGKAMLGSNNSQWSTAMRYSRRRELTVLSCVNKTWRVLIQQRLYRHIKLKGTLDSLEEAQMHLACHPTLRGYVHHVEIWYPVFCPAPATHPRLVRSHHAPDAAEVRCPRPSNNIKCTLEESFRFVQTTLPRARIFTLEGGERRKAPKIVTFRGRHKSELPVLESVHTLITKGQWNLVREDADFVTLLQSMPNLAQWHASYSRGKSKSYISMARILPRLEVLAPALNEMRLCIEGDGRRETHSPVFYRKVAQQTNVCCSLVWAAVNMERFSYSGRLCHHLFDGLAQLSDPRVSKLRSIDITVKNCCRSLLEIDKHESASGIMDLEFIRRFESLTMAAIKSLAVLKQVTHLRIRFIDLDAPLPQLNPFFSYQGNVVMGVWSPDIIAEMERVRPMAQWQEINDTFGTIEYGKDGKMVLRPETPGTKIRSLPLSQYRRLTAGSHRMTIT